MTNKRDLKALVRERMEKTGESYQKALQAMQDDKKLPVYPLKNEWPKELKTTSREAEEFLRIALRSLPPFTPNGLGEKVGADTLFSLEQIAWCADWISSIPDLRTKRVNTANTSYGYKHAVERWTDRRGRREYVSNGAFIVAAIGLGFEWQRASATSPNLHFNFSQRACRLFDAQGTESCPTEYGECVLPKGHRSDEHGDDHQSSDGTWWNVGRTAPKQTATDRMRQAIEAWGITIGEGGKLTASDGRVLKARWSPEASRDIANDLKALHGIDGEVEMARAVLDAVFMSLMGQDTMLDAKPEPEVFEFKQNGRTERVVKTAYEAELFESVKELLPKPDEVEVLKAKLDGPRPGQVLVADLDARRLDPETLNTLTDEVQRRYAELAPKEDLVPKPEDGCACGERLGSNPRCPFHHPPVVTEPQVTGPAPFVALGGLSEPGAVDVAQKLVEQAIAAHAAKGEVPVVEVDTSGMTPEEATKMLTAQKAQYRTALGKPPLDANGRCSHCKLRPGDCGCEPRCPPIENGVCVYCGRMPHACACGADPVGTKYARCTNCELVYKLFPTKSRICEHCGHAPVEVVPVGGEARCAVRSQFAPNQFHLFAASDKAHRVAKATAKAAPDALSVTVITDRDGNPVVAQVGLPMVITNLYGEREPTIAELVEKDPKLAIDEDTPCSCGGVKRIGPPEPGDGPDKINHDDPDCLFHHPFSSEDSPLFVDVRVKVNGEDDHLPLFVSYERLLRAAGYDPERTLSVTYRGKLMVKCDECDGGRWFDASHAASKRCEKCQGKGERMQASKEGILSRGQTVQAVSGMVFNIADTSNA